MTTISNRFWYQAVDSIVPGGGQGRGRRFFLTFAFSFIIIWIVKQTENLRQGLPTRIRPSRFSKKIESFGKPRGATV